jgi:hypothetical protein
MKLPRRQFLQFSQRWPLRSAIVLVGCLLMAPLALTGIWLAERKMPEDPDAVTGQLREEKSLNGSGAPLAVVAAAPSSDGAGAPHASAMATGAAAPASAASTEPKRVRTVTVYPDSDTPPAEADRFIPAAPVPASAAASPLAEAPQDAPPSQSAAPPPPAPQLQSPVAAVDTVGSPARATPRAVESGGWVVQLSAQKTEVEAQTAFRAAQTKYSLLGSYQPLIRKKDQGERGVFYAAQVGPLARDEANQLCSKLKSAGGSCFIQRN